MKVLEYTKTVVSPKRYTLHQVLFELSEEEIELLHRTYIRQFLINLFGSFLLSSPNGCLVRQKQFCHLSKHDAAIAERLAHCKDVIYFVEGVLLPFRDELIPESYQ